MAATATARNAHRNAPKKAAKRPVRITNRGVGVLSLAAALAVVLVGNGHTVPGAALGLAVYLITTGKGPKLGTRPNAVPAIRALCWGATLLVVIASLKGTEAPGGPVFGFALAAALVTALSLTGTRKPRKR